MSYCRFGDNSDVYVYCSREDVYVCCACSLDKLWEHVTPSEVITHLELHVAAGHQVPQYAFDRLREDVVAWLADSPDGEESGT